VCLLFLSLFHSFPTRRSSDLIHLARRDDRRDLIVNADDFGQSAGVNRGIIEAHERGIVTSASLMVRWPAANEATAYARRHQSLRSEEHTSELQSRVDIVCRLL